jgi:sugar O-acyltransferase (sialic acid O-acetyltransferase NeuD family)
MTARGTKPLSTLVLGPRPHAQALVDSFDCLSASIRFVGYVENLERDKMEKKLGGLPIYWQGDIGSFVADHGIVCGLSTTLRRSWIEECEAMGFKFPDLVHSTAIIAKSVSTGSGVILDAGSVVASFTKLSNHCRVGRACTIGHHTEIGRYTTLHPGSIIAGNCKIGEQVLIGSGSTVIDGVSIGDGAVVAPGCVVRHDVPAGALVAMRHERFLRHNFGPR